MRFNTTIKILWEQYYPYIITIFILGGILWLSHNEYVNILKTNNNSIVLNTINDKLFSDGVLNTILTIEGIIFGFLLAVLALTIQSTSLSIQELKKAGRFNEMIAYNKHSVICAFYTIIFTVILLLTNECFEGIAFTFFKYIWGGFTILNVILTYRFLDIFYTITKE